MIFSFIILAAYNIGNAYHDAKRIKAQKKINHADNAFLYVAVIFFVVLIFHTLKLAPAFLALRPLVFDNALNLFRNKPFTYVSPVPMSIVDKIEKALFGRGQWLVSNLVYVLIIAINIYLVL